DDRPVFPVEVFPEVVARFTRRVAAAMGCPIDFIGVAVMVISGAAIGAARSVQVKPGWDEKPGMYAVIVSRPGTTKTPARRAIMPPVELERDRLYQDPQAALRKYREDVEAYRRPQRDPEDGAPSPARPVEPRPMRHLFVNDCTVEALGHNLSDNPKGLLVF